MKTKQDSSKESQKRYEVVLLEDDKETLEKITSALARNEIIVYPFVDGRKALEKIISDIKIEALVTDIEIRYPYPNGDRGGLQGYDVANLLTKKSANRIFSIIVLTALEQDEALDSINLFENRIFCFSKMKWRKFNEEEIVEKVLNDLAGLIKSRIECSPILWYNEIRDIYPDSRWIKPERKGDKIVPPYWGVYCELWMSKDWNKIDAEISKKALSIFENYEHGEVRRLQGDFLTLRNNPTPTTFCEHLIARRVIYALKANFPTNWALLVSGKENEKEESLELDADTWNNIKSEQVKIQVNAIHNKSAEINLRTHYDDYLNSCHYIEKYEAMSILTGKQQNNLRVHKKNLIEKKRIISDARTMLNPMITDLLKSLENEDISVKNGFVSFLRFWGTDFTELSWVKKQKRTNGGQDPLQQTLRVVGIRKEDISDENIDNWKLLLPEERNWLQQKFGRKN